jgi:2-oxoisovalerate dehydrogenase E1 component alpha subunit
VGSLAGQLEVPPAVEPASLIGPDGSAGDAPGLVMPGDAELLELYRRLVLARRFDRQAVLLARQGRLAVYPSCAGQEACQVGAVGALAPEDWMFPTYRDTVALVLRGIPPVEALSLLRGDWHCGYDPRQWRTAPQCTPLATQALHGVGLAMGAKLCGDRVAVLVFLGDGATSEGDAAEAMNFAAVYEAPVVLFIENNQYAISLPVSKQTKARSLAHRALGFGIPGYRVDGNDVAAVHAVVSRLLEGARDGAGPALVEAVTYRMAPHTNSDNAARYRSSEEERAWGQRGPIARLETYLEKAGALGERAKAEIAAEAEAFAAGVREAFSKSPEVAPEELFAHVYSRPSSLLESERAALAAELR